MSFLCLFYFSLFSVFGLKFFDLTPLAAMSFCIFFFFFSRVSIVDVFAFEFDSKTLWRMAVYLFSVKKSLLFPVRAVRYVQDVHPAQK